MYTISSNGILNLKKEEGEKLSPYKDIGGKWTIGVGHLIKANESFLMNGISSEQSTEILRNDLSDAIQCLNNNIKIELKQDQVDSLISLIFNIGCTAFKNSMLLKLINEKSDTSTIFDRWVKHYVSANGIYSDSLYNRRKREAQNFIDSTDIKKNYDTKENSSFNPLIFLFIPLLALFFMNKKNF